MKEKSCSVAEDNEWFQYQVIVRPKHYWTRDRRFSYADNKVTWEMAPG